MATKGQPKDIKCVVLHVYDNKENAKRGTKVEVRTVDWIVNGKHYKQCEKREFFTDQSTGEWKMGKAKGFTPKDLLLLMDNWDGIMVDLGQSAAAAKATAPVAASAPAATDQPSTATQPTEDF